MKLGDVSGAINACITLNQWGTAITLAETHQFKEIEQYLTQYGSQILSQNRQKEAVELFRKANYCQKSARLMFKVVNNPILLSFYTNHLLTYVDGTRCHEGRKRSYDP